TAGIRDDEIHVRLVGNIAITSEMPQYADIAALAGGEYITRVSAKCLRGSFEEDAFWRRKDACHRESCVVDPIFAGQYHVVYKRPVDPWQYGVVQRARFAKIAAEFAYSCNESTGHGRKGDVAFFKIL